MDFDSTRMSLHKNHIIWNITSPLSHVHERGVAEGFLWWFVCTKLFGWVIMGHFFNCPFTVSLMFFKYEIYDHASAQSI